MSDQIKEIEIESGRERFVLVDALRGIAAVMVLSHHLLHNTVLEITLRTILPAFVCSIFTFNARGVEIFFVISGFVIAHSMRNVAPTLGRAGKFIIRRQLRLDPPYWAMIGLTLLVTSIENRMPSLVHKPMPTVGGLFVNLFYLQNILHLPQVVGVSWTLCIEIQFYLCFIVFHLIGRLMPNAAKVLWPPAIAVLLLGILSLFWTNSQQVFAPFFLPFWSYFAAGVLCYWSYRQLVPRFLLLIYLFAFAIAMIVFSSSFMAVGLATVALLFVAGENRRLCFWLSNGILQYFGRISYSLYLVHLLVLSAIMRGGYKLTHENRWAALCWFIFGGLASVVVAHFFHMLIEAPSMRLTARIRQGNAEKAALSSVSNLSECATSQIARATA